MDPPLSTVSSTKEGVIHVKRLLHSLYLPEDLHPCRLQSHRSRSKRRLRVVDLTWMLASAGTTVLLASLGAEVIRIEWPGHIDFTRRQLQAKPKPPPLGPVRKLSGLPKSVRDIPEANASGLFSDRNAGKLGITLNMRHP